METEVLAADEMRHVCRSCMCKGDNLIPIDVPYNHIVNTKYDCVDAGEPIANLMMSCGNVQIEPDDGLPQSVCIKCFMNIRAMFIYRQMCERSDAALREMLLQQLSIASVKSERTDADQDTDPLEQSWFDETKPEQEDTSPDVVMQIGEIRSIAEAHRIPVDTIDTIPSHSFEENLSKAAESRTDRATQNRKAHKNCSKANAKTKIDSTDQSEKKEPNAETKSVADQTVTSNETRVDEAAQSQFICKICARAFSDRAAFNRHASVHTSERNFVCDICKRRYKTKKNLYEHLKIHVDKAKLHTHLCAECGARFKNASLLITHLRRHTGERPFKCDHCDKAFHAMRQLTRHRGIHDAVKAFICSICSKEFSRQDKFKLHMMMHNDIRPHKCRVCSRGFTQPVLLKKHMLSHAGRKEHVCKVCGVGFTKIIQLINHRTMAGHMDLENEE